jgi:hypothetical protein
MDFLRRSYLQMIAITFLMEKFHTKHIDFDKIGILL